MDAVLHGMAIYVVLLLLFRLAGKKSLADASISDLLLLLIVGESLQQALIGRENYSVAVAAIAIVVLLGLIRLSDFVASRTRQDDSREGTPIVLVQAGEPLADQMTQARITEQEILTQARRSLGLERMDQIEYAVLDMTGKISILPRV
ncbi:MAG TPA: YetF domain-containing protein [Nocardioidaceae bacterium]|nr:YetF domain-containing protein [Nocardioidaceae bacterium]